MLFNSLNFLYFFIIVTTLYFALPHRARCALLVVASCFFYMCFVPKYILILLFLVIVDYFAGLLIERAEGSMRTTYLVMSLIANLGVLGFYKYFNFINENVGGLVRWLGWNYTVPHLDIILPIGLSFHTFQSMSYTFEVYYRRIKAEKSLSLYTLYVMFYPQLVAGPIERPQNLLTQFKKPQVFNSSRTVEGLRLILGGMLKKVLIADKLAVIVDLVYSNPRGYSGFALILPTFLFSFQVYCDFSGYSDIARGCGKVMGINMMLNFKQPYLSSSITEFWRRWHISLFSWFKDYVYLPIALSGSRSKGRMYGALFFVFVLSGIWHGAGWNFIIFGSLHGIYCVIWMAISAKHKPKKRLSGKLLGTFVVFNIVSFAFIFFRAQNLSDAWYIITHLFGPTYFTVPIGNLQWVKNFLLIFGLIGFEVLEEKGHVLSWLLRQKVVLRWSIYYAAILAIIFFGAHEAKQFIYFQF